MRISDWSSDVCSSDLQDMLDAVLAAIERDRQQRAVDRDISKVRERFETLSAREQQVMQLVTVGKLNKQVAGDLGISEVTVKIHRAAVMRKMGARSLADLIRRSEEHTSELQSLMRISYAVFCLKKKKIKHKQKQKS